MAKAYISAAWRRDSVVCGCRIMKIV